MRHMDEGLLQAWLDGPRSGLTAEDRAAVEAHVAHCPECAARLEALRETDERVRALLATGAAEEELPAFEAVLARARELETPAEAEAGRRPRWRSTVGWAASIAVAAGAGWLANAWTGATPETILPALQITDAPPGAGSVEGAGPAGPTPGGEGSPALAEASPDTNATAAERVFAQADPVDDTVPGSEPAAGPGRSADVMAEAEAVDPEVPAPAPPDAGLLTPIPPMDSAARVAAAAPSGLRATPTPEGRRSVTGRVVDAATGRPLVSAQVFIPGRAAGALTNAEGRFMLTLDQEVDSATTEVLPLQVTLLGYRTEERTIEITGEPLVLDDVGMATVALSLDEVVVTGTAQGEDAEPVRVPGFDDGGWSDASIAGADGSTRFPVRTVPDLPVASVHVGTFDGVTVVGVVQELEDGRALTLLQSSRFMTVAGEEGGALVRLNRDDGVFVIGWAELPADSVRALLERLR